MDELAKPALEILRNKDLQFVPDVYKRQDLIDIPKMYEECKKMILEVKESLENENEDLAREIALQDDKIDSLYNRVQELSLIHI